MTLSLLQLTGTTFSWAVLTFFIRFYVRVLFFSGVREKTSATFLNHFYLKVLKHFCKRSWAPFPSPVQGGCLQSAPSALEMCLIRSRLIIPLLHMCSVRDTTQSSQKANLAQFLLFPSGENSIKNWLMLEFSSRINKFLMWWKWIVSGKQLSLLFCTGEKKKIAFIW